jgi:ATP-binding cassette subfamily F protein 3
MIQLSSAGKRFGPKLLFENLDWLITPRDRVGLVGANGTGKTTLLKVLARREAEIEGYAQELTRSRSAADSARLAKLIERGREEVARLLREWEDKARVVEEQEAERISP